MHKISLAGEWKLRGEFMDVTADRFTEVLRKLDADPVAPTLPGFLTLEDLPESLQQKAAKPQKAPKARALPAMESEARQLTALLEKYGHTLEGKKRIASELNISLRTLYRKLDRLRQSEPGASSSSS